MGALRERIAAAQAATAFSETDDVLATAHESWRRRQEAFHGQRVKEEESAPETSAVARAIPPAETIESVTEEAESGRATMANGQIIQVITPKPIARRLHEVLSDPTVPEIERVRLEQLVSLAMAMAHGEGGA